jgi:hypothetical protein
MSNKVHGCVRNETKGHKTTVHAGHAGRAAVACSNYMQHFNNTKTQRLTTYYNKITITTTTTILRIITITTMCNNNNVQQQQQQ